MYIVIETLGGPDVAAIVTDSDGNNRVFDTLREAEWEAMLCQAGIVVKIP